MSSRRKKQQKGEEPEEPQEQAQEPSAPLTNVRADARKQRKMRKAGLLKDEEEAPVQAPDTEAVVEKIKREQMASAVSGITQKAFDAADTNSKDVSILGFDMKYKDQSLLEGADLRIFHGRKYGIIGPNGAGVPKYYVVLTLTGKSTLLKHIAHGMLPIPKHIQVLYVEQEIDGSDTIALDAVVAADTERIALLKEQEELKERVKAKFDLQLTW